MELQKKYIHMSREKGEAVTQITLDDDFNVPDVKPDLLRIIMDRGEIRFDETNITQDHVWLKGVLKFSMLYRSDQDTGKIDSLTGEIPFQESLGTSKRNYILLRLGKKLVNAMDLRNLKANILLQI